MPASRTFNYELLKRLVQDHPDWSHHEYASALTNEARKRLREPGYPRIRANTVAAAISRYRDTWLEDGVRVPARKGMGRLLPWVGIPEAYRMDTRLRRLRTLAQLDQGEQVDPRSARLAEQFARTLRENRQVLDLTGGGRPVVRAARPDEVDGTGELIALWARWPGLTDEQWAGMSVEERRSMSARWFGYSERQNGRADGSRHAGLWPLTWAWLSRPPPSN